jgi:hypothetical protein
LGGSATPYELALGMILWEYLVHGWDRARATGQSVTPPALDRLLELPGRDQKWTAR